MTSEQKKNKKRQSHRIFAKSYWRKQARLFSGTGIFSEENINRMKRGLSPRRLALLIHRDTGEKVEMFVPRELHHVFGMKEEVPQEEQTIVELYPWQHADCDED